MEIAQKRKGENAQKPGKGPAFPYSDFCGFLLKTDQHNSRLDNCHGQLLLNANNQPSMHLARLYIDFTPPHQGTITLSIAIVGNQLTSTLLDMVQNNVGRYFREQPAAHTSPYRTLRSIPVKPTKSPVKIHYLMPSPKVEGRRSFGTEAKVSVTFLSKQAPHEDLFET
ncbi:hypothetical protein BDD12DRAFT_804300 [Trichophaea hybrida]|nr:hypothetical protein BDD12DRAFT_804300 [Trichophaea hybrida]